MRWAKSIKEFLKPNKEKLKYFLLFAIIFCTCVAIGDYSFYSKYGYTLSRSTAPIKITPAYLLFTYTILISAAYLISCGIYRTIEKTKKREYHPKREITKVLFGFTYWIAFLLFLYFYSKTFFSDIVIIIVGLVIYFIIFFIWLKRRKG